MSPLRFLVMWSKTSEHNKRHTKNKKIRSTTTFQERHSTIIMITHANSSNHVAIENHVLDWSTIRRAAYFGLCPRHSTHVTPCYFCFWNGYFTKWVTCNQYKQRSWQGFVGSHFSHSFFSFLHFLLVCFTVHIRTLFISTFRSPEVSQVSPQLVTNG